MFTESAAGEALQKNIDQIKADMDIQSDFQFFRRGVVDCYKDELSEELVKKLDQWSMQFLDEAGITSEQVFGL